MITAALWSALATGTLLDGTPESPVLGLSLVRSPQVSPAFIFAVAISNIPQGLGGTAGMLISSWPRRKITWPLAGRLRSQHSGRGAGLRPGHTDPDARGAVVDALAAGALSVMLSDSTIPEAFEHGGNETGLSFW